MVLEKMNNKSTLHVRKRVPLTYPFRVAADVRLVVVLFILQTEEVKHTSEDVVFFVFVVVLLRADRFLRFRFGRVILRLIRSSVRLHSHAARDDVRSLALFLCDFFYFFP